QRRSAGGAAPPQAKTENGTGRSIQQLFEATVGRVSRWTGPAVGTQDQLVLYGLYKQASFGDCHSQRPGLFDPTGRAKWNSWKSCDGLGVSEAMQRYCRVADAVCPENRAAGFGKAASNDDQHDDVDRQPQTAFTAAAGNGGEAEVSAPRHVNSSRNSSSSSSSSSSGGGGGDLDLASRHVEPTAATRGTGERSTERLRRRAGRDAEGGQAGQMDNRRSAERSCSAGPGAGAIGGGGIGAAGVGKVAVAVALALVVVLARRGDRGALEAQEEDTPSPGWPSIWQVLGAWWGAWTAFVLFWVLSAAAGAGCLWCAVRVARWREEIFAQSPVVPEALSRATAAAAAAAAGVALGPGERAGRDSGDGSSRTSSNRRGDDCGGISEEFPPEEACVDDDPVGYLFRPGTQASRDFCAPRLMPDAGNSVRGGCCSVIGGSTATAAAVAAAAEGSGAVVFLTGVTGLVGQMVLFDLLRQGAAVSSGGASGDDGEAREGLGGGEDGLGGVASGGLRAVVVLVRGKKGVAPSDRLASIRDSAMFRPLRESGAWVDEETDTPSAERASPLPCPPSREALGLPPKKRQGAVVVAVEGELGGEGLGLSAESRALLAGAGVTHALHCAASVSFSDPLAEAAATNVTGALRVAALVASWPSCGTLIHVSTAFVHGGKSGTASCPLPQELPDLGGRSPERLYRSAQRAPSASDAGGGSSGGGGAGKEALDAMSDLGYPNTYTFTKALGEHLLVRALSAHNRRLDRLAAAAAAADVEESGDDDAGGRLAAGGRGCSSGDSCGSPEPCRLRLRVVRPSIVGPAWVFPWPGWTGEQPSTVTGCQVLVLQRAVKTFRLGPHPAPIIPVDVVSRAIVHSALGWGGPLTSSSPAATTANIMAAIPDIPGSHAAESRPDVVIRNLAWATHPVLGLGGSGAIVARKRDTAVGGGDAAQEGGGMAAVVAGRTAERMGAVGSGAGEGRMPSFREISGLLYDYAVLRGMRPSLEALAMRSSFAAASVSPPPATAPGTPCVAGGGDTSGGGWSSSRSCPQSPFPASPSADSGEGRRGNPPTAGDGGFQGRREAGLLLLRGGGLRPSLPRLAFDAMHLLLDRSPVWALQGLAALAERVGVFGGSSGYRHGGGGRDMRRRTGVALTLRRLDKLAALPAVYETFTWQEYFFDSALRVPEGLKPAGYALETALASELLQRSLPGGAEEGAKASPERRQSILRELGLQIRTHRSGGLRCGGRGDDTGTSLRVGGAPKGNRVAVGEEEDGGGGGGRPLGHNGDDVETNSATAKENNDDGVGGAGDWLTRRRRRRRRSLSVLCGRADRLVPWPALAWWAATLPGSAARGGVTLWVRLVAFAVRVVMSRAASAVAVDVDSFREAAPPGYGAAAGRASRAGSARGDGVKEDGAATVPSVDGEAAGGGGGSDGGYIGSGGGRVEKSAAAAAAAGADGGDGWRAGGCGGRAGAGSGGEADGAGKVVVVLLPTHRSYL
ncbi:unnamed protein product, partial [Ectocarpus sp. 8 AP-2014]